MRATALCCALAAISCSSEAPVVEAPAPAVGTVPRGPPLGPDGRPIRTIGETSGCEAYADLPDVYGFCLVQWASRGQGRNTVDDICSEAGSWDHECRMAWVTSRADEDSRWSTDALLDACPAGADDCRFEVLDKRPNRDVALQIQLCMKNARTFAGDCTAHALERWVRDRPSLEEIERVAQSTIAPDRIGQYIAALRVCYQSIDECVGSPAVQKECNYRVGEIRQKPEICEKLLQSPAMPQVPMGP